VDPRHIVLDGHPNIPYIVMEWGIGGKFCRMKIVILRLICSMAVGHMHLAYHLRGMDS